jgi:spore germination protein YaaH
MRKHTYAYLLFALLAACSGGTGSSTDDLGPPPLGTHTPTADPKPDGAAPDAGGGTPAPAAGHRRCGWVFTSDPPAKASYLAHADFFDALHPVWYALNSDGVSIRALSSANDVDVTTSLRTHQAALIPLVASVENAAWTRTMLYDPAKRAAHIKNLVEIAVKNAYDGLDLDYEHLWNRADHDPLVAFVKEFGAAMHAAGKRASIAAPALAESSPVWDYAALAASLDEVHLMGYDFHNVGTHAGPTAPLGWIEIVAANAAAIDPGKFILGLPNYGLGTGTFCVLDQCAKKCTGPIAGTTDHMSTCPLGDFAAGRILNCDTAAGRLYFDDAASLGEKAAAAQQHKLRGIGYWSVGGEPADFWGTLRKYY